MQLGRKIQEVRLQKKLTQKEVVGEYMTRNMLSKIENGSATPSVKTLEYLAGALGVPVVYFMSDTGGETVDGEQLGEIITLAGMLCGEIGIDPAAVGLCIKARALLAGGDPEGAAAMLRSARAEKMDCAAQRLVYQVLEDAYKALDDYKMAYEYATKRLALNN